jgi:hypothetical protein
MNKPLPIESAPPIAINILGIGEITTTIEVSGRYWGKVHPIEKRWMRLAYKRMPPFESKEDAEKYIKSHNEYQDLLATLGIFTPWHDNLKYKRGDGKWIVYNRQERFVNRKVACLIIRNLPPEGCIEIFNLLLSVMIPLFEHNLAHPEKLIGFDGQISNWVLPDYTATEPCGSDFSRDSFSNQSVLYIDTSTPLLRYDGAEQLDTELFLKSIPSIFRPIVRSFLLQGILDRYYVPREVVLDLIASFITHGRPDMVPALVSEANTFLAASSFAREAKPFTAKEIVSYNREDVMIWKFFRTLKRIDRYLGERFFHKTYEQRLPHGSPSTWQNLVGAGGQGLTPEDEPKS